MGKDQEFLEAARNGNITLIEKILSQKSKRSGPLASLRRGPGINVQDNGGYSALHYSALNGHTDIVRLLLIHEASPNLLDSRGSSALHLAAWAGHQEIVKMLLTHPYKPANPDMQTMENDTPLHCAAQHGHTGALTTLLAHGANPNVYNSRNETPLDLAAQYGRLQAVQMLIRAHPELLQSYYRESDTFSNPTSSNSDDCPTVVSHSALHLASRNGHNNVVEILLAAGVNVNLLTPNGTALHEAALCGKDVVVRTLLEAGADLNARDCEGRTPLDILQEFPPHVTKGIISVIKSFRTNFDVDLDHSCNFDETHFLTDKKAHGSSNQSIDSCAKTIYKGRQLKSNNDEVISPSVSINSFEPSMAPATVAQASSGNLPEFYVKMPLMKLQKPAPKKPPRRNLSISPTHIQSFFQNNDLVSTVIEFCGNEAKIAPEQPQNQNSYEYICTAKSGAPTFGSNENLNSYKTIPAPDNLWYSEKTQSVDVKPTPAPRKLKNQSSSCETSALKSYNPNRKLKRNRENYFAKGQFSLTISSDMQQQFPINQITPSPTLGRNDTMAFNNIHKRPLSQEYTCAPDYLNVESGLSPQDHPLCLSQSSGSISSGVSLSDRSVSTDCVEEFLGDKPFAGLFKGSAMNLNNDNLMAPNGYFVPNDYNQSEVLRLPCSGVDTNNARALDSPPVSSDEAFNNGNSSRGNKKEKSGDETRCAIVENRDHKTDDTGLNKPLFKDNAAVEKKTTASKNFHSFNETDADAWQKLSEIMETFGNNILNIEGNSNGLNSFSDLDDINEDSGELAQLLKHHDLQHLERTLCINGYDTPNFVNGIIDERDLTLMNISGADAGKLLEFVKTLPYARFKPLAIDSTLDYWLKSIQLVEYRDNFKKHLYNTFKSVCGVWEIELQTVLEINKIGHRKRILHSVAHIRQPTDTNRTADLTNFKKCGDLVPNSKGTLGLKKNRPAPKPPLNSLEIRAPSELLIGLPSNLRIKWPHSASSLISNFLKYEVYYLGSTVVKELRGTESTRKSIQKLKRVGQSFNSGSALPSKLNTKTSDFENQSLVQLSISYRGVEFIDIETNGTICEHEIRNINCACQDADDMRLFAYITKDSELNNHYCHVFNGASMHLAMEIILTLAESFEVAYQMALRKSLALNKKTSNFSNIK